MIKKILICSLVLFNSLNPQTVQAALTNVLNNTLQKPLYKGIRVGILIKTIDTQQVLYSRDVKSSYMTASVIKILTSGAALDLLGPQFVFHTLIKTDGSTQNKKLMGNIYLVGSGDPLLKLKDLRAAAQALRAQGIDAISGDLIYDTSRFKSYPPKYPPNARHFYAPPGALSVNYNWMQIKIDQRHPPKLSLSPKTNYAKLIDNVTISDSKRPGRPPMTFQKNTWGDTFTIKGTITQWDRTYQYLNVGVTRPGLYTATLFKEACIAAGIKISGTIKKGTLPKKTKTALLHRITSPPLEKAIRILNQESNNVIADMITLNLGASEKGLPGTRTKGLNVLRQYCSEKIGFTPKSFSIGDGVGLSKKNKFSAQQIVQLLENFYKNKPMRAAFLGTLAHQGHHPHARNPVPPAHIKMLVKTGTLSVTGVNAVAGYIFIKGIEQPLIFAIMANRPKPGPMTYSGTLTNPLLRAIVKGIQ